MKDWYGKILSTERDLHEKDLAKMKELLREREENYEKQLQLKGNEL